MNGSHLDSGTDQRPFTMAAGEAAPRHGLRLSPSRRFLIIAGFVVAASSAIVLGLVLKDRYAEFPSTTQQSIPVAESQYPPGTRFLNYDSLQFLHVESQWAFRDGKQELVFAVFASPGVGYSQAPTKDLPAIDTPTGSNDPSQFRVVSGEGGLMINGRRMPLTPLGRIFVLLPDGRIERVVMSRLDYDALTPQDFQNSSDTSLVWQKYVHPVVRPFLPEPPSAQSRVTRVIRSNRIENNCYSFAQWRKSPKGTVLVNALFTTDRQNFIDGYSDDEESLPEFPEKHPHFLKHGATTMELLPTGMYVNNQLLQPGEIAVIQDDATFKTLKLTYSEREALTPRVFDQGFHGTTLFREKIAPLFGPNGQRKINEWKTKILEE